MTEYVIEEIRNADGLVIGRTYGPALTEDEKSAQIRMLELIEQWVQQGMYSPERT